MRPDFLPDVDGVYKFELTVSNATQPSAPSKVQFTHGLAVVHAIDFTPVSVTKPAKAGET